MLVRLNSGRNKPTVLEVTLTYTPAKTLLLRIRAETLRLNLQRAHCTLKNLPDLSSQFSEIQSRLSAIRTNSLEISKDVGGNLRQNSLRGVAPERPFVDSMQRRIDDVVSDAAEALKELELLGGKSFFAQVRPVGLSIWQSLDLRAGELLERVQEIEKDLSSPGTWTQLADVGKEASGRVFDESIELLGGIALRDTRLDADICELADALVGPIRASGFCPSVIPGSVSSLMMTVDSIIRLRFPEWTVWALPFAAHEFWRVSVQREFDLASSLGSDGKGIVKNPTMQMCAADTFATYIMGPAYAYAAITLLFDPRRPEDELRVAATLCTLERIDSNGTGALTESYHTIAKYLREAWDAARRQADRAAGLADEPAAQAAPADPSEVERVVDAVLGILGKYGYSRFDVAEWTSVKSWTKPILDGTPDSIRLEPKHDLRYALNAAWQARLDDKRTADISAHVTALAARVKAHIAKPPPASPRGSLRGLL
jgi:hypothetical protein